MHAWTPHVWKRSTWFSTCVVQGRMVSLLKRIGISAGRRVLVSRGPVWRLYAEDWTKRLTEEQQTRPTGAPGNSEKREVGLEYAGISANQFSEEAKKILMGPLDPDDIEIKPDGIIYLPEIRYRRILNKAFGPGGWALAPRGDIKHFENDGEGPQLITREYALYCLGHFVSQAIGEHTFYTKLNLTYGKAVESSKSNALMRCCKDLGVASELWDPKFISEWKSSRAVEVWCENVRTKEKKKLWKKKGSRESFAYPWRDIKT